MAVSAGSGDGVKCCRRVGEWAHLHELGLADALQLLRAVRLVHGAALRKHGLDDVVAAVVDVVGDVLREVDLLLEAVALRQPQVPQVVVLRQKQSVSQRRSGVGWGGDPAHGGLRTGSTMGMSGSRASSGVSRPSQASMAPFSGYDIVCELRTHHRAKGVQR